MDPFPAQTGRAWRAVAQMHRLRKELELVLRDRWPVARYSNLLAALTGEPSAAALLRVGTCAGQLELRNTTSSHCQHASPGCACTSAELARSLGSSGQNEHR